MKKLLPLLLLVSGCTDSTTYLKHEKTGEVVKCGRAARGDARRKRHPTVGSPVHSGLQGARLRSCSRPGFKVIRGIQGTVSRVISAVFAAIIAACAWQSGVQKIGENKYQVSANASPARGGETGARAMALSAANKQCDSLGKKIDVTDVEISHAFPANGVATVTFFCR